MTVPTRRRMTRLGLRLLIASGIIAGYGAVTQGITDAHDFAPTAGPPVCTLINGEVDKVITVTVTNQFDMAAKAYTASMSGSGVSLPPNGSNTYTDRRGGSVTGTTSETVVVVWTDGFRQEHDVSLKWGGDVCEQPPTTVVTGPTTTVCPPGQHPDGSVSPCAADTTTTVPAPTTTVKVCEDGKPPSVPVEDGSLVCPEFGAPTVSAPPPTPKPPAASIVAKTTVPTALPTTGSSDTIVIVAGVGALLIGAVLLLAGRRGEA